MILSEAACIYNTMLAQYSSNCTNLSLSATYREMFLCLHFCSILCSSWHRLILSFSILNLFLLFFFETIQKQQDQLMAADHVASCRLTDSGLLSTLLLWDVLLFDWLLRQSDTDRERSLGSKFRTKEKDTDRWLYTMWLSWSRIVIRQSQSHWLSWISSQYMFKEFVYWEARPRHFEHQVHVLHAMKLLYNNTLVIISVLFCMTPILLLLAENKPSRVFLYNSVQFCIYT